MHPQMCTKVKCWPVFLMLACVLNIAVGKRLFNGNWLNAAHHIKSRLSCQAVCGSVPRSAAWSTQIDAQSSSHFSTIKQPHECNVPTYNWVLNPDVHSFISSASIAHIFISRVVFVCEDVLHRTPSSVWLTLKCCFWMLNNFYFVLLCKLQAQSI